MEILNLNHKKFYKKYTFVKWIQRNVDFEIKSLLINNNNNKKKTISYWLKQI